ncbi:hypothetical protein PW52_07860 [Tamlana sedimentorum]|uniref:Uncharacterized protein n=1 Tax=Neotamlana sedimentorum TaxID=1435349 RepID=A0A0D7WD30_9FLAO|nr:hypothetical protein PW52_07860 [Tamlana sedimentorum]
MKKLIENLKTEINIIESEIDDVLLKAEKGIKITKRHLERLRETTVANNFKSKAQLVPKRNCRLMQN